MQEKNLLLKTAQKLLYLSQPERHVLSGYDGFIDELCRVVKNRENASEYTYLETIAQFGDLTQKAAGISAGYEIVPTRLKMGGNGPIMAKAQANLGFKVSYIGALGKEKIHPLFQEFSAEMEECLSFADPGFTTALEFDDGKIMLGKLKGMEEVNWDNIKKALPAEKLTSLLEKTSGFVFANWTMLYGMNSIMEGIIPYLTKGKLAFIDLADPKRRKKEDIALFLALIEDNKNIVLGLNENEANIIGDVLSLERSDLCTLAAAIRERLQIGWVVVHPIRYAVAADMNGVAYVDGPYMEKPKFSTGAGDNFNAGFFSGLLFGFEPEEALICGVGTSGFYVRHGFSPQKRELAEFLRLWAADADKA